MNYHVVAFAILSLVASRTHGHVAAVQPPQDDADADDVQVERQCRYAADELSQYELFQALTNGQRACMGDPGFVVRQLMTDAKAIEEMRALIRDACEGAPEFHRCLAEVTEDARLCLDEQDTAFKMYRNVRDFIEAAVESTCSNRSEGITVLMYELIHLRNESMSEAEKCLAALEETRFSNSTEFTAEFSHFRYQTIRSIKMCIVDVIHAEDKPEPSRVVAQFFDKILAKMTCICFETFEVGLCGDMYVGIDM